MTTLDPTTIRTQQASSNLYLSILHPVALLTALVSGAHDRGDRTIVYDTGAGSGFASILAGMTLLVETDTGPEIVRVKSITGNQTTGTVTLAENGIVWGDNDPITIYHNFELWPIPPSIRSGIFYKDYDIAYSGQNLTPTPVAISQGVLAGFLTAGSITFTISLANSYAIASGATLSSYAHSVVHNGGGTTGVTIAAAASATTTVTITVADEYWHYATVTDSNGQSQTIRIPIFVHDADNMPVTSFQLQPFTGDWESGIWRFSITATDSSNLTLTDIPDGSYACIWQQGYFNSVESYTNLFSYGNNIINAGYFWSDNDSDDWDRGTGQASFEIINPIAYLDAITDYGTISLEAATSPATWAEYASWLTVGRGIHALLKWDTTLLDIWPVYGLTDNTYGVKVLEFTEETLLQRINGVGFSRGVHTKLNSDMRGTIRWALHTQMWNDANRATLDNVFTITEADISGGVNVTRNQERIRAFADMDGFTYSHPTSTPFISMMPGYQEGGVSYNMPNFRGTGTSTDRQQVLNSAGGQTDCNERVGRRLALDNVTPREIRFATRGNYLGAFEPTFPGVGWNQWGVANSSLKRELALNGLKMVCISCTHTPIYENDLWTGLIHTTEVVLQPEAQGPAGIPGNYPTSYPAITTPEADWEPPSGNDALFVFADQDDTEQGKAFVAQAGSVTIGAIATFETGTTDYLSVCALSSTKVLVAYRDKANSNQGTACVMTISGTTVTPGTPVVFDTSNCTYIDVASLSATQAIVCYRDAGNSNRGTACILDVSGTVITPGTAAVFETGATDFCAVVGLTSTKAIVAYSDDGNSNAGTACVLDVSGSIITPATPAVFNNTAIDAISIDAISSTSVLITMDESGSDELEAVVLSGITTTFTTNSIVVLDSSAGVFDTNAPTKWVRVVSATQAIVVYQGSAPNFRIYAIGITLSGVTITGGAPVEIGSFTASYDSNATIATVSNNRAIVYYSDENTPSGRILTIDFNGGTITENGDEIAVTGYPIWTSSAQLVD